MRRVSHSWRAPLQTGTHNELVDRPDGLYRTLFKLQEAIGD